MIMDALKREEVLRMARNAEEQVRFYHDRYLGPGLLKKVSRLLKYRLRYMNYFMSRIRDRKMSVDAKTFWGRNCILPLPDWDSLSLYYFGTLDLDEQPLIKFLIKNIKKDTIFFDIGANYGFYSALASEFVETGQIHAFEPHPFTFSYLKKSLNGIGNIVLNQLAVSSGKKRISFYEPVGEYHSGGCTTIYSVARKYFERPKEIHVNSVTLDDYTKIHPHPSIIKMDIEGGEFDAIEGGKETIRKYHPIIVLEVWGGKKGEEFSINAVERLYELGYKSYKIEADGSLVFLPKVNVSQYPIAFDTMNFVFM